MKQFLQKILLAGFVLAIVALRTAYANNVQESVDGKVIWDGGSCDYYIIETNRFYVLAERYTGRLNEGDKVSGELHGYRFKYLKNITKDSEVKVYVENYWPSKDTCFNWLQEHDKCK